MFSKLELPPLPVAIKQDIINYTDEYIKTWEPASNAGYDAVHPNEIINISKRKVLEGWTNDQLTNALQDICPHIYDVSLYLIVNDNTEPGVMPPHTDFNRKFAVNYIIETGGDAVETTFYEDFKLQPVIENGHIMPRYFNEKKVIKVTSEIFKEDEWFAFDAQRPHGVKNITGKRVVICMSTKFNLAQSINNE